LQNPKPEKQPSDKRVSVDEYLQDSFKLPNDSKKSSKNACNEEEKEVDKFMQNALKIAKKLEGRDIIAFNNNTQSNEVVEEELEKIRRTLGITVRSKNTPSTQQMMPTPSAASSS
jgi:tRNA U54 and U55 pseudouridine synthase Pus10